MPAYDFRCQECGHKFTKRIAWQEKPHVTCPECGSKKIKEVFGAVNFLSKGGSGTAAGGGCTSFG